MRKFVHEIYDSLISEPGRWTLTSYRIKRDDGLKIWTANGFWFHEIDGPHEIKFTFWEKIYIHRALRIYLRDLSLAEILS